MWRPVGSPIGSVARDLSNPHTGSASMQITSMGGGTGASSDCITGVLSGTYSREFWYRTTDTNVITLQLDLDFYTSTNCTTGASVAGFVTVFPVFSTTWQHVAVVHWRTASEAELVGFNLYREQAGRWARLNRGLIPAAGHAGGAAHSFLDRGVPRSATGRYRLQAVGIRGSSRWFGPVKIAGG